MIDPFGVRSDGDGGGGRGDRENESHGDASPFDVGPATIAIDDVSVSFGDLSVLEDVSATVRPGEFVGLVGPNGAGKTTLLRTISGALEPDAGRVTVDGVDVHDVPSRESSRLVAVVPQDTTLSFSFPVRDVVEMGRHPHRSRFSPPTNRDREAVARALEHTRTAELADRPIDEISGGQRQRVVLARAIAQGTPALLLDEPTASLDVNHAIETLELVRELVADGRTAVAAIHDLDLAARYCDRLVMVADGGVRSVGSPAEVLTSEALADAFDATATVTPNPVTGTETVTALPDADDALAAVESATVDTDAPGEREPSTERSADAARLEGDGGRIVDVDRDDLAVHVLGTGTTAAGVLARLETAFDGADRRITLTTSVGPVTPGVVTETADRLGVEVEVIEAEPHAALSEARRETLVERIRTADATVLADPVLGSAGVVLETLEAAEPAALVVTDRRPLEERNFAGETARRRYERLRDPDRDGVVEATPETVLEGLSKVLGRGGSDRVDLAAESATD
ncbi:iron complex transport system ATP-binding protein [Halobiforma haloterrestris]|uniref:Cobalamin import ATP-binding protein BtuD n=1 Tax=Natronobacterium haloterrestre TaxID=148448 RepID=A0A1I1FME8_NATHA|nr:ATP-binding cassette domain-containing protein [Halobiforma haloterrestris]SFC00504.1 iron complex transport system ATP-binding protein [Halobiforma haloterrestris]